MLLDDINPAPHHTSASGLELPYWTAREVLVELWSRGRQTAPAAETRDLSGDGHFLIIDPISTNVPFVNGARINLHRIQTAGVFLLGSTIFILGAQQ